MTDNIAIAIQGDREVGLEFGTFPDRLRERLLGTITKFTKRLEGEARAAAPSRTGKLKSEIHSSVFNNRDSITGVVFVQGSDRNDYAKAGAEEYGAHGIVKVGAHSQRLDHLFGDRLLSPLEVSVGTYSRQADIIAQRFLRTPLATNAQAIEDELRADVDDLSSES